MKEKFKKTMNIVCLIVIVASLSISMLLCPLKGVSIAFSGALITYGILNRKNKKEVEKNDEEEK